MQLDKHKILSDLIWHLKSKYANVCDLQTTLKKNFALNLKRKMRITLISDTHQLHTEVETVHGNLPGGDLLIHAGDFMNTGIRFDELRSFCTWFSGLNQYTHKVFIAGNHDIALEDLKEKSLDIIKQFDNIVYLEDQSHELQHNGKMVKLWGTPWQPEFNDWAFNLPRCGKTLEQKWQQIPDDTDILITHTPPQDHLDVSGPPYNQPHLGCELLRVRVDELKPKINVFGHVHGSYGYKFSNSTHFFNASCLNERYNSSNKPITFDWNCETNEIIFI